MLSYVTKMLFRWRARHGRRFAIVSLDPSHVNCLCNTYSLFALNRFNFYSAAPLRGFYFRT
eukprot:4964216-Amphidinium_carterae.1